jgi:hypothetical protein
MTTRHRTCESTLMLAVPILISVSWFAEAPVRIRHHTRGGGRYRRAVRAPSSKLMKDRACRTSVRLSYFGLSTAITVAFAPSRGADDRAPPAIADPASTGARSAPNPAGRHRAGLWAAATYQGR